MVTWWWNTRPFCCLLLFFVQAGVKTKHDSFFRVKIQDKNLFLFVPDVPIYFSARKGPNCYLLESALEIAKSMTF